jgi:methyl-accepting chemotaxis protein
MILIIILIAVFVVIIVWNLLNIQEGLETYEDYDLSADSQCMILANQNAGNISYLKQRVDELANIQSMIYDLSMNVDELNTEMSGVVQQQMDYAEEIAGGTTPYEISGTTLTDDSL